MRFYCTYCTGRSQVQNQRDVENFKYFYNNFFFQLYGGTCSSILLTAFSKLFTAFLQRHGFSLGVEDILVVKDADEQRFKFITRARKVSDG